MNVLFVTHDYPNYVPDLLLHGLRKLLGPQVVDYPRKDCVYKGVIGLGICPDDQRFPDWFPDDLGGIDRDDIPAKAAKGFFDLVVCDYRALSVLMSRLKFRCKYMAVIDGEDKPQTIRPGNYVVCRRETDGTDYSIPLPMALPEEVLGWITHYDDLPKIHSIGFLGSTHDGARRRLVETLAGIYPDTLFAATQVPDAENPLPSGRLGRGEYYRRLQQCRVVISLAGAGMDTFRFWENAACNAIHAAENCSLFIPADFIAGREILRFCGPDDVRRQLDVFLGRAELSRELIIQGRRKLVDHHLTTSRARYFLDRVRQAYHAPAFHMREPAQDQLHQSASAVPAAIAENIKTGECLSDLPVKEKMKSHPPSEAGTLFLGLVGGENYGWGVCSRYLIGELSHMRRIQVLNREDGSGRDPDLAGPLFQALISIDFEPMYPGARGSRNFGYTFFENELTHRSRENAKRYDLVLGGSSWCRDRMLEKGITNCDVLIQGIDPDIFYPLIDDARQDPERFVIFSGGKFELRKGQDLVLRAVKILQEKYADVWLVNCWYNLWPASTRLMSYSKHIRFQHHEGESWQTTMLRTYSDNGLDPVRIKTFDLLPQNQQRDLFAQTTIGVFPNRCEGGTNLVLMEYMACAKPVIVSNTSGHKDIATAANSLLLNDLANFNVSDAQGGLLARWQEPSLDELVARLEWAYHHREAVKSLGMRAGEDLQKFTWRHTARSLLQAVA